MGRNEQNLFRSCSNTTVAEEEIRKKTKGIPEGRVSVYEATFGGQRRVFSLMLSGYLSDQFSPNPEAVVLQSCFQQCRKVPTGLKVAEVRFGMYHF